MSVLPHLLIVDSSRVIRVTLAKDLKAHFEIREESSAELAWEALILDASIVAVVCGISLPGMDGLGLLEKIRTHKLERLKTLPFLLIASDSLSSEVRERATAAGVSGFVPKGAGTAETQRVLRELLANCCQTGLRRKAAGGAGQRQAMAWFSELLEHGPRELPPAHVGEIGLLIMPVLQQMERTFGFGLPIEGIERKLKESLRDGRSAS